MNALGFVLLWVGLSLMVGLPSAAFDHTTSGLRRWATGIGYGLLVVGAFMVLCAMIYFGGQLAFTGRL